MLRAQKMTVSERAMQVRKYYTIGGAGIAAKLTTLFSTLFTISSSCTTYCIPLRRSRGMLLLTYYCRSLQSQAYSLFDITRFYHVWKKCRNDF